MTRPGSTGAPSEDVAAVVTGILRGLGTVVPASDTDLIATGALDSFAVVEMLLALEARFGVRIPMEQLELSEIRSVDAITQFIGALVGE